MTKTQAQELTEAVQLYLDLMYDCDTAKFDRVFAGTSQLLHALTKQEFERRDFSRFESSHHYRIVVDYFLNHRFQ